MRIEFSHGKHILCGGIIPAKYVKPGQIWASSSGGQVTVIEAGDWVKYAWFERGGEVEHEKDNFSFQCRYCLVVNLQNLPSWLNLETMEIIK